MFTKYEKIRFIISNVLIVWLNYSVGPPILWIHKISSHILNSNSFGSPILNLNNFVLMFFLRKLMRFSIFNLYFYL